MDKGKHPVRSDLSFDPVNQVTTLPDDEIGGGDVAALPEINRLAAIRGMEAEAKVGCWRCLSPASSTYWLGARLGESGPLLNDANDGDGASEFKQLM